MNIPRSTAGRTWLAFKTVSTTFGSRRVPFVASVLFLALRCVVSAASVFDAVIFRNARRQEVRRPIVIGSLPRTGSTFLHRFLIKNGVGTGVPLWRMLFPSPTLQAIIAPVLPLLSRGPSLHGRSSDIHETGPHHIETDDAALYFRFNDGFFLFAFHLAFTEDDLRDSVAQRLLDTSERDFDWLESFWSAHLSLRRDDRIIAKLFSLGIRLPAFLSRFPDARIIYLARDPVDVIPSTMSLATQVLEERYGFWSLDEAIRRRYLQRLYEAVVELLRRFHDDWIDGRIDRERVLVVRYDRMMSDFEGVMDDILMFVGFTADEAFEDEIARQHEVQRRYTSTHTYALSRFGLTEAKIRRDCSFFYEAFLSGVETTAAGEERS